MKKILENIHKLYDQLLESKDSIYNIKVINECKSNLDIQQDSTFGEYYYKKFGDYKATGTVYTPKFIVDYMLANTIRKEDIIRNPFLKIVDPSCGVGNIILPCYQYLKKIFEDNLEQINKANNLSISLNDISEHIVNNNLHGVDIDKNALKILQIDLLFISKAINDTNYLNKDFLQDDFPMKYDIFIGNPPYIGHKLIDKEYRKNISYLFKEVYKDKGDISYCFFLKANNIIDKNGKITFIVSRYFMESFNGDVLRKYLLDNCNISRIVDFYGVRPFKKIGIDPVIIFLDVNSEEFKDIEVLKIEDIFNNTSLTSKEYKLLDIFNFSRFTLSKDKLGLTPWVIINEDKRRIIDKIESKSNIRLGDVCETSQGIITGCDRAFIIDKDEAETYSIEKDLLKPWIKNSNINKEAITPTTKYIIYSDLITNERDYPRAIKYIGKYRERLQRRRECVNGIREWYGLQWGRKKEIFEGEKIVFPYKAGINKFALDKGSYFSADVYAIKIKDKDLLNYSVLLKFLNSKIYDFYFKTFAKKLGNNIYEYYPNNLVRLKIPLFTDKIHLDEEYLYDYFELSDYEKKIIIEAK